LGLILIAEECEDLLLGNVSIHSEKEFTKAWLQTIRTFDQLVNNSPEEDQRKLFSTHVICGNGYMVCKKLEDLIKDVFSVASTTMASHSRDYCTSAANDDDDDDVEELFPMNISSKFRTGSTRKESFEFLPELPSHQEHAPIEEKAITEVNTRNEPSSIIKEDSETRKESNSRPNSRSEGATIPRKEENNPSLPAERETKNENTKSSGSLASMEQLVRQSEKEQRQQRIPPRKRAGGKNEKSSTKPVSLFPGSGSTASNQTIRLIDYYPNFGMIFPVAYNQLGTRYAKSFSLLSKLISVYLFYFY
jgi:hypothetical protein